MMEHPGIAKVFDAGMAQSGRSYFVMEFVDGKAITEHLFCLCIKRAYLGGFGLVLP